MGQGYSEWMQGGLHNGALAPTVGVLPSNNTIHKYARTIAIRQRVGLFFLGSKEK